MNITITPINHPARTLSATAARWVRVPVGWDGTDSWIHLARYSPPTTATTFPIYYNLERYGA